jgi:hypothetical protein
LRYFDRGISSKFLTPLVYPSALCADSKASLPMGNESALTDLLVPMVSFQAQSSPGDASSISNLVVNLDNFTMMNAALAIEHNESVDLNLPVLLPEQSANLKSKGVSL